MVIAVGWLAAVSISAEIGCHDGKSFGQLRGHVTPFNVRLRIAVQEQQRRPASRGDKIDRGARGLGCKVFESRKKIGSRLVRLAQGSDFASKCSAGRSHRGNT